jgi:hypothetical protein
MTPIFVRVQDRDTYNLYYRLLKNLRWQRWIAFIKNTAEGHSTICYLNISSFVTTFRTWAESIFVLPLSQSVPLRFVEKLSWDLVYVLRENDYLCCEMSILSRCRCQDYTWHSDKPGLCRHAPPRFKVPWKWWWLLFTWMRQGHDFPVGSKCVLNQQSDHGFGIHSTRVLHMIFDVGVLFPVDNSA